MAQTASQAFTNPGLRRELAVAGVTRSELLLQSIRMIQVFLSQSPNNPLADEASLALVGAFTELEDFKAVDKLAARFAKLYPKSTYLDSFQYSEALANFHLGQYDRAIEVAADDRPGDLQRRRRRRPAQPQQVAGPLHSGPDSRRPPPARQGAGILSPGGRPFQRRRQRDPVLHPQGPEGARGLGRQVRESAGRGGRPPALEPGRQGLRVIDVVAAGAGRAPERRRPSPESALDYRNIGQVDVKVYPVDLMQLYLTRRNLNGIAGIDLAGVTPLVEKTVALGDGADYDDKSKSIDLPLVQGRGLPDDDPGRQPVCLGDRAGHAAGDGGARGAGRRPRPHHGPRRSLQGVLSRRCRSR